MMILLVINISQSTLRLDFIEWSSRTWCEYIVLFYSLVSDHYEFLSWLKTFITLVINVASRLKITMLWEDSMHSINAYRSHIIITIIFQSARENTTERIIVSIKKQLLF